MKDERKETDFVYIGVKTEDGEKLTFATTRPELLPSCVGMSVNPNDKRYSKYVGKKVIMPLTNAEITITTDSMIDPDFGGDDTTHISTMDNEGNAHILEELPYLR